MKKTLSYLLCVGFLISTFVFAPLTTVSAATGDVTYDFNAFNTGDVATNWGFANAEEPTVLVTADKTIKLTSKNSGGTPPYDSFFTTPTLNLAAGLFDTVKIGLKWTGVAGGVTPQMFYTTATSPNWAAGDYMQVATANDAATDSTGIVEFTFNASAKAGWVGTISKLRLDPADKAGVYELAYVTFVSNGKVGAVFAGVGNTIPNMVVDAGTVITLPTNTYALYGSTFGGWNDGTTTYQAGATYTLNTSKTFNAVWIEDPALATMAYSWEFNTPGSTDGWTKGQKMTSFVQSNGNLVATSDIPYAVGANYDSRMNSPTNLHLNTAYSIIRMRMRHVGTSGVVPSGGTIFYTRYNDDLNADGVYGIVENGVRNYSINITGNQGYVEYTYDLSTHAAWTSEVAALWMDPIRGPLGSTAEIDYIRLYKKGANTLTYNKNTTGTVTGLPANDTMASKGTGYKLSGQIPVRAGYVFLGWSATAGGTVIADNTINITENATTVYAVWREAIPLTATFSVGTGADAGSTAPATINTLENGTFTVPSGSTVTRAGYSFIGWNDGTKTYAVGATYTMGTVNVTFTPMWQVSGSLTFLPANAATGVDYRNLFVKITFPLDVKVDTLTPANISSTWAQSVTYDAGTHTATVYLKPASLTTSTTVSFTTTTNILTADGLSAFPATAYSITTMTTAPSDGENLLSNGNFELPFNPTLGSATGALVTDDTPAGTGTAMKFTAAGAYSNAKFNMFVKPNTVYYMEFDGKLLNDTAGNPATTNLYTAFRKTDGADTGFGGLVGITSNTTAGQGWKHFAGYTNSNANYTNLATGAYYFFIFSDKPTSTLGVNFMLDNVVVKEAYAVNYAPGTVEGKTISGTIATKYGYKGATVVLPTSGFTCPGKLIDKWTDGTNDYAVGANYIVPLNGATLTAVWKDSPQFTASFVGGSGATGTAPSDIIAYAGDTITLPANPFTKTDYFFKGWSDGTTIYPAGAAFTMPINNVTFTALWTSVEIVGLASEFNTIGTFDGWDSSGGFPVRNIINGYLQLETMQKDARMTKVLTNMNNTDGKTPLSSDYNLVKIRYRKPVSAATAILRWQRVGDDPGTNDVVAAELAGRRQTITFTTSAASDEWVEQTIDLSGVANWNGNIRAFWLDPVEYLTASATDHGKIDIDYIRFYRKGATTVSYDTNGTTAMLYLINNDISYDEPVITNMPATDALAATGKNYVLSGNIPKINTPYLRFLGWSTTEAEIDAPIINTNQVDINQNTMLYAVWGSVPANINVTFTDGVGTPVTVQAPWILDMGYASVVLPQCTFNAPANKEFAGWSDGTVTYLAGDTLHLTKDTTFTTVWSNHKYHAIFDIGEGATSNPIPDSLAEVGANPILVSPTTYNVLKTGYYFGGWIYENGIYPSGTLLPMPANDITLTALWIANPNPTPLGLGVDIYGGPYDFESGTIGFVAGSIGKFIEDPTNANNTVFQFLKGSDYANMAKDVVLQGGRRYFISYKAYVDPTATGNTATQTNFRYSNADHPKTVGIAAPGVWTPLTNYFDVPGTDPISGSFTLYTNIIPGVTGKGYILYDDISVVQGYKVTYKVDGADFETAWTANKQYTPSVTTDPVKEGFDFMGWSLNGTDVVTTVALTDADITLTAVWKAVVTTVTLSFDDNTDEIVTDMPTALELNPDTYVLADLQLSTPVRTGYTFKGWSIDGTTVITEIDLTDPTTLLAVWEADPVLLGIRGDANGDNLVTAYDAVVVLQIVAGLVTATPTQTILGNSNGDASGITAYDAVIILQYVAGLNPGFNIGQPVFQ